MQAEKQAKVNTGQASSMLQIADGAMSKVNDILVRMKTLALQSGSGQFSSTERGMLDTEYQALTAGIDRIAQDTELNGTALVNGSSTTDASLNGSSVIDAAQGFASIKLDNDVGDATISVSYDSAVDVLTLTNLTTGGSKGIAIGNAAIAQNVTQVVNFDQVGVVVELHAAFDKSADIDGLPTYLAGTGEIDESSVAISNISDAADFAAQTGNVILDDTGN